MIVGIVLFQNIGLLLKSYDSGFLRLILKSNDKRKEEVRDADVLEGVERLEEGQRLFKEN